MKVKLLKKARKAVSVVNWHGFTACNKDKLVTVKRRNTKGHEMTIITPKGKVGYISFAQAMCRRRDFILDAARELNKRSMLWHAFH